MQADEAGHCQSQRGGRVLAVGRGAGRCAGADAGGVPGRPGSTGASGGPSSLRILAWHVVVMIAMEIISVCFVALRCCVLHCLAGKLLDWFWRVAVHAQALAEFFFFFFLRWKVGDSQHGFN